jgi:hypothetical protein
MEHHTILYGRSERSKRRKIKASVDEHIRCLVLPEIQESSSEVAGVVQCNVADFCSISQSSDTPVACSSRGHRDEVSCDQKDGNLDDPCNDYCDDFRSGGLTSDSDSCEEEDSTIELLRTRLAEWAVMFNISHAALSALLCILRQVDLDLPKDARTLLLTPKCNTDIKCIEGGSYHYFGIVSSICHQLETMSSQLEISNMLTLHLNVDGLPLFRSSNVQLWPILGMLAEVREPFLIGIFCGPSKPKSLDEFLLDFIQEMKVVLKQGLSFMGRQYSVKIGAIVCDAPARSFLKCTKGHSGYYSCERCTQEGQHIGGRMTFPEFSAFERTDDQFRAMVFEDHHTGVSPFMELGVGCVSQFVLDYMHLVCLGVMRRLILLWLKGPVKCRLPSTSVQLISAHLLSLRCYMPRNFCRKPKSLEETMQWKATEFRQFLLYTGPVVLLGRLGNTAYRNFLLLSISMMILLNPSICQQYCDYAEQLLAVFVKNFASLYGSGLLVYNVHSLLHLPQDVRNFGALDGVSAFPFENYLGQLKKTVRSAQNPVAQIVRRTVEKQHVRNTDHAAHNASSLKRPHSKGPLLSNMSTYRQYCHYKTRDNLISCCTGDNCFEIHGKVAVIHNVLVSEAEQISVVYEDYEHIEPFFQYPLDSSALSIHVVSGLSGKLRACRVEDVGKKFVALPLKKSLPRGGRNIDELVRRVMKFLMKNSLERQFNMVGRFGKRAFGQTALFNIIYRRCFQPYYDPLSNLLCAAFMNNKTNDRD